MKFKLASMYILRVIQNPSYEPQIPHSSG